MTVHQSPTTPDLGFNGPVALFPGSSADPELPFTVLTPSADAWRWARKVSEDFARGIDAMGRSTWAYRTTMPAHAEGVLAHLYAPGLPTVIDACDRILRSHTPDPGWSADARQLPFRVANPLTELLQGCDADLRARLVLWFGICGEHPRATEVDDRGERTRYLSHIHSRTSGELARSAASWTTELVSLFLYAEKRWLVRESAPIRVCEQLGEELLGACARQLQDFTESCRVVGDPLLHRGPDRLCTRASALRMLLRVGAPLSVDQVVPETDVFGDALRAQEPELLTRPGVAELFVYFLAAPGARPTRAWREGLRCRLERLPDAAEVVHGVLEAALRTPRAEENPDHGVSTYFVASVQNIVNGSVWALQELAPEGEAWATALLERTAVFTGTGPGGSKLLRSERTAMACVRILAGNGTDGEIAALARVRARVKKKTLLKAVDQALSTIAEQMGITGEQLVERTVPDFGLGPDGSRTDLLGQHRATVTVHADGTAALGWVSDKGRLVTAPPAILRQSHPEQVEALRSELKELRRTMAAEQVRLEGFLADGRVWDTVSWIGPYIDHPVTGALARRLLWEVSEDGGATWECGLPQTDGDHWRLVRLDGTTAAHTATMDHNAMVRLWHPVRSRPRTVRRWREHLTERETAQPCKQAHREIYLLTPAEEETRLHSNRHAAHVLKYGQAKALLNERGWSVPQLGGWSEGESGTAHRVRTDRESGTWWHTTLDLALVDDEVAPVLHCGTGQMRFHRQGEDGLAPLAEVPALVLSEAMRDIDLAVGVTSIAADPEWVDHGTHAHRPYWRAAAFGELTENAEVRREALARLLPRLKEAERLEIRGRFLRVRGDLRSYRIHLGSANILMEPDDSYLCVVPSRRRKDPRVFLPFERDGGRLALVLSKALMLAQDTSIEDEQILAQIRRGATGER